MYAQNIKNTAVYFIVHMGYFFIHVFTKPISSVWSEKANFFVSSDHSAIWSSSRVW